VRPTQRWYSGVPTAPDAWQFNWIVEGLGGADDPEKSAFEAHAQANATQRRRKTRIALLPQVSPDKVSANDTQANRHEDRGWRQTRSRNRRDPNEMRVLAGAATTIKCITWKRSSRDFR